MHWSVDRGAGRAPQSRRETGGRRAEKSDTEKWVVWTFRATMKQRQRTSACECACRTIRDHSLAQQKTPPERGFPMERTTGVEPATLSLGTRTWACC